MSFLSSPSNSLAPITCSAKDVFNSSLYPGESAQQLNVNKLVFQCSHVIQADLETTVYYLGGPVFKSLVLQQGNMQ